MPSSSFILLRLTADTRRSSALLTIPGSEAVQGPAAPGPACCTMRGGGGGGGSSGAGGGGGGGSGQNNHCECVKAVGGKEAGGWGWCTR